MKRHRAAALVLALLLLLGLLAFSAGAAQGETPILIALNDNMPKLNGDTIPITVDGTVYLPATLFDSRIAGNSLGVFYGGYRTDLGTLTLYSRNSTLVFDLNGGYAYDYSDSGIYDNLRGVVRNGRVYVPAYLTCEFFDLDYAWLNTSYGPMVRIKNGAQRLDDRWFVQSAETSTISNRLNEYFQSQTVSKSPVATAPTLTPTATPAPPESHGSIQVYLAIQVESGLRVDEMLDALESRQVYALFFFRPEDLLELDDVVRRAVGLGHQVGLTVSGESVEELEQQLEEGNLLLAGIARTQTSAVLAEAGETQRSALEQRGWRCWQGNVDGRSAGRGASAITASVMQGVDSKRSVARVLLDDVGSGPSALPSLLRRLQAGEYELRLAVETEL